jgi:hypothetical protein
MAISQLEAIYPLGVGIPPDHLSGGYAARVEWERTKKGDYPAEWQTVAWLCKVIAGWKCERCGHPHSGTMLDGFGLTVHHLDKNKRNLQHWNLASLCQRCHLRIESRVQFYQDWPFEHSGWMAIHVAGYNEWAAANGQQPLSLVGVAERDYTHEWPIA